MTDIWQPISLGSLKLPHRFAMAPMTRSRANPDGTPSDLAAEYYGQRASAGLLISEGTQPSDDGQGYLATPGIYTDAHVGGWRKVTTAVHDGGGHLFIQLMHVGRVSHPDNTPHHRQPVAPSAVAPGAQMFTLKGMLDIPEPRALNTQEISGTVEDLRIAARRAIEAGADGVEIHGANGYLVHQFLAPSANMRTDQYGGGIKNRARFAIEVAAAIVKEIGAEKTAIRLSPGAPMNGIDEGNEGPDLYRHLVGELNKLGLAYLHLLHLGNEGLLADIRKSWSQTLIINRPSRSRDQIGRDVAAGKADMEAYGQMILANPDFIQRLKTEAPLNEGDRNTFYAGGAKGYVDYPTLATAGSAATA
jgi:N-ethylmaleimide reductase